MDKSKAEQIAELCGRDVLRFCRITAGNTEEGDELYQDTMLILLEKQERLDLTQNVKSYAISVVLRLWKNRRRKFFRRLQMVPQVSLEDLAEEGIQFGTEETLSPEALLLHRDQVLRVRRLVERLPEKDRLPIQLYYSAGLTISAIAQVLNLPENTVKSRLRRAKEKIRRELEEQENEGSGV